ncbi:hypothetical protein TIFTF001_035649 [Ficus carica]|uniref:Uncharacterized protein n=1 Tax=Ficus carica TaxID=3494 RepID=A0AA88JAD0_FICCA|nr:hypothetical protein TIFTF001_035649 [Ficus carica]
MVDMEIVDRAKGCSVYTVDYFTTAVIPEDLESLRVEFQIPDDIKLIVPAQDDLLFHPPLGHIMLQRSSFGLASVCPSTPL